MKNVKIIIITGLSGSGKSIALAALEDAGFYCVDNMPVKLLPKFLEMPVEKDDRMKGIGFVMDLREKGFLISFPEIFSTLKKKGYNIEILFLEAEEAVIVRRYSQTRRHHPLGKDKTLIEGIRAEIKHMQPIRALANQIIDTSHYNVHEFKSVIFKLVERFIDKTSVQITIMSFGFKYGIPHEADLIMDVRFMPNPFFVENLKSLDGRNEAVKQHVLSEESSRIFLKKFYDLVDFLLPLYEKEGKAYLTIAVGCTGGQHRSVAIADSLYAHMNKPGRSVRLTHRDVDLTL
jgi:RNase adapter protein RapZ